MRRSIETIALAALVTAAVTFPGGGAGGAKAHPAGTYQAVIMNVDSGNKYPWTRATWPDKGTCTDALGNLNAALRAVAGEGDMPDAYTGSDPRLVQSVDEVVTYIYQNTGKLPNLSIACELAGDPA